MGPEHSAERSATRRGLSATLAGLLSRAQQSLDVLGISRLAIGKTETATGLSVFWHTICLMSLDNPVYPRVRRGCGSPCAPPQRGHDFSLPRRMSLDFPNSNDLERLREDVVALRKWLESAPTDVQSHVMPVLDRVLNDAVRRRQLVLAIQDALSQLRIDMKYLVFDLEATRRERDVLRRKLEGGFGD